jgi:D-alanyl-D-alanine dipeptidase
MDRVGRALWALLAGIVLGAAAARGAPEPPLELGPHRKPELVDIASFDPAIRLDIRYATPDNFTGHPLYAEARAILQRPVARALARADRRLRDEGVSLVIWDAYRPWSVTRILWESAPPEKRSPQFVADPRVGSMHNRGCAVDVTLYDLRSDKEAVMPSAYDEFSERARADYKGGSTEARRLRDLLRAAMETQGFTVNEAEWWHFNHRTCKEYPLLDIGFEEVGR